MRRVKVITAKIISEGQSHWLAVTFEEHPKKLCLKISDSRGGKLLKTLFGNVRDSAELLGRTLLMAELPRRRSDFCCWEPVGNSKEIPQ